MEKLSKYIDYTNLSNKISRKEINQMIDVCIKYNFYGLCIAPCWVVYAKTRLEKLGATTKVITVPNWFSGGGLAQCEGTTDVVCEVADEIDFIWNPYNFSDLKDWDKVAKELEIIRKKTKGILKVIVEAYYLRRMDENVYKLGLKRVFKEACRLVKESGSDFIKTDSGLYKRPDFETLVDDIKIIKKYSKGLKIKAAGGIKTKEQTEQLIKLGVSRIGTSSAVDIVEVQ